MEITGRLTADAEVRKTGKGKEFVSFTVVVNDYFKPKDGEAQEFEEFFNCTYWLSTKIADSLLKGSIVTVVGRVHLNQYKGKDGSNHANLAFHVNGVKIIARGAKNAAASKAATNAVGAPETKEDLPF